MFSHGVGLRTRILPARGRRRLSSSGAQQTSNFRSRVPLGLVPADSRMMGAAICFTTVGQPAPSHPNVGSSNPLRYSRRTRVFVASSWFVNVSDALSQRSSWPGNRAASEQRSPASAIRAQTIASRERQIALCPEMVGPDLAFGGFSHPRKCFFRGFRNSCLY